jgi:hypothetical protein
MADWAPPPKSHTCSADGTTKSKKYRISPSNGLDSVDVIICMYNVLSIFLPPCHGKSPSAWLFPRLSGGFKFYRLTILHALDHITKRSASPLRPTSITGPATPAYAQNPNDPVI